MNTLRKLIKKYISSHNQAWASTTLRSEEYRLLGVASVLDGLPDKLWMSIARLKPYSRNTLWIRVSHFWDWLIQEGEKHGENPYKQWKKKNAKQFKNAYQKNTFEISFKEAWERLKEIKEDDIRTKAYQLLKGGLRFNESLNITKGTIKGKGGKIRPVFVDPVIFDKSYNWFYKKLKEIGFTPHMLRKIRATDLARRGCKEADLCKIFGWSSFNTASSYIAPVNDKHLAILMKE